MTNVIQIGGRIWSMRRRSTRTADFLSPFPSRRNRSASDSVVHERRHQRGLTDHIEINVELRNLRGVSLEGHIICILYENEGEDEKKWRLHSSSEPQSRTTSRIEFLTSFTVDYVFERSQLIKIEIRTFSARSSFPVVSGTVIGCTIFKLDELIGAFGAQLCRPLSGKATIAGSLLSHGPSILTSDYKGTAVIKCHLSEKAEPVFVQFAGKNLDRKGKFFDETEVYFQLSRVENSGERSVLYQSEGVKSHSHPVWKPLSLQMKKVADNRNRLLEVCVMYRDEVDKSGLIGTFLTSYAKMKYGPGAENVYNVVNHKKASKKGYVNSGTFELVKFMDVSFYSFLDYVTSGTQLHLAVAVDFSVRSKETTAALFDYHLQLAVKAVANIIRDYSPNKLFPSLGFGAKVPPAFMSSQEFCMNFDTDPCCRGIDGVLDAYRKACRVVVPIERACLAHIIHYVAKMAVNAGAKGLHYYVLTIFVQGGPISDLKETLSALVHASQTPLSVVFIGIGDGDFEEYHRIASTGGHLNSGGRRSERDIVEFVELQSVIDDDVPAGENQARIAEQALHNVPRQMVAYMHKNNIAAKPPIQISRSPVFHASYLIPDRPSEYIDDYLTDNEENGTTTRAKSSTPSRERPLSDRRPTYHCDSYRQGGKNGLTDEMGRLSIRATTCRSHSAIDTSREKYQARLAQRKLLKLETKAAQEELKNKIPLLLVEGFEANSHRFHSKVGRTPSDFH